MPYKRLTQEGETIRIIEATRRAASDLKRLAVQSRRVVAESREVIRRIDASGIPRLSSDPSVEPSDRRDSQTTRRVVA